MSGGVGSRTVFDPVKIARIELERGAVQPAVANGRSRRSALPASLSRPPLNGSIVGRTNSMSLDIRVHGGKSRSGETPMLSFDHDGYYLFLHPLFERLRDESGKYIDLYGDARFTHDDFPRLRDLLAEAELMTRRQPTTWEVHIGTQLKPVVKELYQTVNRDALLKLIDTFRTMVDTADEAGGYLECTGD
jgi:hypothetical protein